MSGDRRVFIGFDAAGDPVVRTSTPGNDAVDGMAYYEVADGNQVPNEISFDSRWAAWGKIHAKGEVTGFGFVDFDALAFYPMVQVWIEDDDGFMHHQNLRTIDVARSAFLEDQYRVAGPSFLVDVEKHRFNIVSMLDLYPDVDNFPFADYISSYINGIDCGTNPKFRYVVWDVEGFG